ncbi:MAG: VCBS repeat-containing protein [Planctomycetaceae bacterium]|nr:VCBS repeat-containing protein [Planctomycetaceae bacterium]
MNCIVASVRPSGCVRIPVFAGVALFALLSLTARADENQLAQYYGFSGVELFELDERAFNLQSGDFNHDGLTDLLVVDNHNSCVRLMIQKASDQKAAAPSAVSGRINDLKSDWRFEERQIGVDRQVTGLATGDFNQDGRIDICYIGAPDRLVVRYQPEDGDAEWTADWMVRLPELQTAAWMIAAGDLNGDKLADIVVLGENVTYALYQSPEGELKPPVSLINTSSQLSMIQIADLNGDGRNDLCYLANEGSTRGLCARLQTVDGRLGPELTFDLNQPRSVTLSNVNHKPGHEIITIEARTGRLQVLGLEPPKADDGSVPSRLLQYGIGKASGSRGRSVASGDLDGDGRIDIAVSDPDQAQLLIYRQNGIDGLGMAEAFPGLLGVNDVAIARLSGEQENSVIILSEKEGVVAVSKFADGRLTFPRSVLRQRKGYSLASLETISGPLGVQLIVGMVTGSGRSAELLVQQLTPSDEGAWQPSAGTQDLKLTGIVGSRGVDLMTSDVNSDGRDDVLVISNGTSEKSLQVLLQDENGVLKLAEQRGDLEPGVTSMTAMFRHGAEVLIARDSFVRSMSFGENGWQVTDQFNAGEASARLDGAAALDLDGQPGDEIVLIDTGVRKLRVLRRLDGLYRPWKEIELGSLKLNSSVVADLNADGRNDLLLAGSQHFAVLYAGQSDFSLQELSSYESDRDDAYLADVIAGDINADQNVDLTAIDTSIDGLEIMRFSDQHGVDPVTHFRVFEEKRLVTSSDARGTEPREGLAVDVTGDGRNDIVLLCHDRLILYPQDPGTEETSTPGAE